MPSNWMTSASREAAGMHSWLDYVGERTKGLSAGRPEQSGRSHHEGLPAPAEADHSTRAMIFTPVSSSRIRQ